MKIGVIGVGHLGKIHLRCISEIPEYEIVGFADTDPGRASEVSAQFGIRAFDQIDELMDQVDAVSIVTPTTSHFELARLAIGKGKHVFIEKPVTDQSHKARMLHDLAKEKGIKVQVGQDRKSTRLNSSHVKISYAVFCLKKKKTKKR